MILSKLSHLWLLEIAHPLTVYVLEPERLGIFVALYNNHLKERCCHLYVVVIRVTVDVSHGSIALTKLLVIITRMSE